MFSGVIELKCLLTIAAPRVSSSKIWRRFSAAPIIKSFLKTSLRTPWRTDPSATADGTDLDIRSGPDIQRTDLDIRSLLDVQRADPDVCTGIEVSTVRGGGWVAATSTPIAS